ncbi:hypothetical protein SKAU_G00156600 [Synaphobranchus kaupii]|uniref:ribonuclease H n=1 Tax=Synaphobranchus kaupii TaxID=118154 RepID=A0A9Q1FI86_SYNKA|nr:hypothetical protein SKAU_G00156600 [Synaphobranchus kaupii]
MLESGVITESASPRAAPVVLVRKDGAWRFCMDYRRLNAVTRWDAYPLPRIEESLTGLKRVERYSTLDLASGYWQVEVDPADCKKKVFATLMGLYQFNCMPFGLMNVPARFQQLMQRCLGDQTHLKHLEEAFRQLSQHGLKLLPQKCQFLKKEVKYFGHVIGDWEWCWPRCRMGGRV